MTLKKRQTGGVEPQHLTKPNQTVKNPSPYEPIILTNIYLHHAIGLVIRLALVVWGVVQDRHGELPYTDVDYHVVSEGAERVWAGGSPFERHTYRYTPLLAWLMLPNIVLSPHLGKLLFCLLDHAAAHIIYAALLTSTTTDTTTTSALTIGTTKTNSASTTEATSTKDTGTTSTSATGALISCLLWLYNPVVIGISTRGSAEAVIVTLVLASVLCRLRGREVLCGALLGAAIHVKLYPVIYCLPLYLSLEKTDAKSFIWRFEVTKKRFVFCLSVGLSFLVLTGLSFGLYGMEYIQEGFLYHLSRVDTRHNFSIWFYFLYLSVDYDIPGMGLITFVPQFAVVLACGYAFSRNRDELLLGMFCQTMAFVAFNKVVTSQYFLWYLVFVPLIHDKLDMSWRKKLFLLCLWLGTQASWLLPAYLFEFKGMNTFFYMWLESIAFFSCNIYVMISVIDKYSVELKVKSC